MRVGLVVINSSVGGTEKRFSNLFRMLPEEDDWDYQLFVPELLYRKYIDYGLINAEINPRISRLYRVGLRSIYPIKPFHVGGLKIRGLAKLIKPLWRMELIQTITGINPDVLHIALPTDHLRPLPKLPLVVELANNTGENLNTWFIKHVVKQNCLINCASEGIRRMLIDAYPEIDVEPRTRVIPCSFIDYSSIRYEQNKPRKKRIVFIGRLEKIKNPFYFLKVIEILSKRRTDFQVSILGVGSLEESMREWIEKHGLHEIVQITYVTNPTVILSDALIYFSAYQFDNYHSQALLEAMANGCAILASDIGETRRVVDDSCGFLTSTDPEEVVKRLDFLLDHVEVATRMGAQARQKVMREQNIERYSAHLKDIYADCYDLWNNKKQ